MNIDTVTALQLTLSLEEAQKLQALVQNALLSEA